MRRQRICAGALALVLGVFCLSAPAMALGPDPEKTYRGIEVSVYQGDIDFQQVRESGVEVVYIRAREGSGYTDPYFAANAEKSRPGRPAVRLLPLRDRPERGRGPDSGGLFRRAHPGKGVPLPPGYGL